MRKIKVNDRVFSKSWDDYGQFFIISIINSTKIVILNDMIRTIVKPSDLALVKNT
jgi:hypothetical protein